ncbi:MAG TPA: Gfo/Idh/MocA family oxidoreductase [Longimicrobiales bacterium]|nr:Gfo/Idh/MocA family oxidoreductase [Longimicrobiales bacterium]
MNDTLKVGVVGVGSLGFHHARILRDVPGARLVGVHDLDPARRAQVAAELGVPAIADQNALLDGIDACVIAVPTLAHERVACAALERGVHVLVEKPIAPDLDAADRILAAAEASGALIQIGHVERFNAALRACEPHLDQPIFVESHRLAPFGPRGTDVAVVLDLMIHDLDLVLSLMQRPVESIAAVGVPVLTASPDIANARIEFEGGGVANLTASRVSLDRMRKIRFFQRSGYISLDLAAGTGEYLRLRPGVSLEERLAAAGDNRPLDFATLMDIVERISLRGDGREPLRAELESFVAAAQGRSPVAVSGQEGRDALAVALEINRRIDRYVAAAPA